MLLNDDIVDIEKIDRICLPTFAVDECSGLFLHSPIFSIKYSRSVIILVSSEGIRILQKPLFSRNF